jgi:hypothetical protein
VQEIFTVTIVAQIYASIFVTSELFAVSSNKYIHYGLTFRDRNWKFEVFNSNCLPNFVPRFGRNNIFTETKHFRIFQFTWVFVRSEGWKLE